MKIFALGGRPHERRATDRQCSAAFGVCSPAVTAQPAAVPNEQGFALLSVVLLLLLALTLGVATLLYTLLDVKSTQYYETGNQALAAAEAGLLDVINNIDTRGVVNFQTDVINSGIISTSLTAVSGFPNVTYQVNSLVAGTNPATDGAVTVAGYAPLSAQRVLKVGLHRGPLTGGAGALHLSNDTAVGTFAGNSLTIDGNNYRVTGTFGANNVTATLDNSECPAGSCPRPAISTRNDTVTAQVTADLTGQGTIVGFGTPPSVLTTAAASTSDMLKFVADILALNGASGTSCPVISHGANSDYWVPDNSKPGQGVHCVPITKGNQGQGQQQYIDFWGDINNPNVTYVTDTTAKLNGGAYGAGVLIFAGDVTFVGNFSFCGWVLFMNPSANGIGIGGNPTIYGEVLSPLPAFGSNGGITIKYSLDCLNVADHADPTYNIYGNLPHPMQITSWTEL
jgi:hypothetical protein